MMENKRELNTEEMSKATVVGIGMVGHETSLMEAVKLAVKSSMIDTSIQGVYDITLNISGKINLIESGEAIDYLQNIVGEDSSISATVNGNTSGEDEIVVTLIATRKNEENNK